MLHLMAWLIWLALFVVAIALSIPNMHLVTLRYYAYSMEARVAIVLLLTLAMGMLLGMSLNLLHIWSLQRDNHRLRKLHKQSLHQINTLLANVKQDTPH